MTTKILLIDDDPAILPLVKKAMDPAWDLVGVRSLAEATVTYGAESFDLLLLDVEIPDGDGFQFCQEILKIPKTLKPILFFLTSRSRESDVVTGFWQGADDYITKPFKPMELRARIHARLIKRQVALKEHRTLSLGNLKIDLESQSVFLNRSGAEARVKLTRTEYKILVHLVKNQDARITREQLLNQISASSDITDRAIDQHVSRLRTKIAQSDLVIDSVYGEGYLLRQKR